MPFAGDLARARHAARCEVQQVVELLPPLDARSQAGRNYPLGLSIRHTGRTCDAMVTCTGLLNTTDENIQRGARLTMLDALRIHLGRSASILRGLRSLDQEIATMSPQTQPFTLDLQDVSTIARSIDRSVLVRLAALDCNWGAPVSGRFDTDFLQVWAVVDARMQPQRVSLSGRRFEDAWNVHAELSCVGEVEGRGLYYLALSSQTQFPTEFVVLLETQNGSIYYDNNGGFGVNYRLTPYAGRVTSAVVGASQKSGSGAPNGAIWRFREFIPYTLTAQAEPAKSRTRRAASDRSGSAATGATR